MRMKKTQLLSTVSVALLLTFGTAYAQGNKDEQHKAPQAAAQDQPKSGQAAQEKSQQNRIETTEQNKAENRSTVGQGSPPEQKGAAQQHEMNRKTAPSGKKEQAGQAQQQNPSGKAESQKKAVKQPSATEKPSTTGQGSPTRKSGNESKPSTAQPAQSSSTSPSANKETQPSSNQAAQPNGEGTQSSSAQPSGQTQQAQGVNLDPQQQTKVSQAVFSQHNVPRVDRVDFSVNVGTTIPSHVHLVAVPDTLIEIHPAWRGDEFFVVRDEIVIVDHSRKIVAVIPGGNRHASSGSSTTIVENMSPAEIREIQTVLIQRGFLHAKADGKFGTETREALIAFQRKEGIEATGSIDTRTVSSLGLSGKIQAGGTRGQQSGGAATTGSSSMSDQKSAPSTSGQNKTPSTSGQNNMPSVRGQNNQGSTSASQMPSKANENQSMTPKASSQPSKNNTTGQGGTTGQGSAKMQNPDQNRDKNKSEAK
jgi:hypothetical protein